MLKATKETILVAGASKGIGAYLAEKLKGNYETVYTTSRSDAGWERHFVGDLSDWKSTQQLLSFTGPIDHLICCVGGPSKNDTLSDDDVGFLESLGKNLTAPANLCKVFLPEMRKKRFGSITLFSSNLVHATQSAADKLGYTLAKVAIEKLTQVVSETERPFKIRVNCISPGFIRTKELSDQMVSDVKKTNMSKPGGYGSPDDVYQTLKYLLQNEFVSGAIIRVDGAGRHE